jgi:hypothetical protein
MSRGRYIQRSRWTGEPTVTVRLAWGASQGKRREVGVVRAGIGQIEPLHWRSST